jgi:DNA polymerase-2
VRDLDPDVLTGWNVVDFDLTVLARMAERLRVALELGRGAGGVRLRPAGSRGAAQASVPGRVVLDGIHLMRGAFIRMDDYGLDAVARSVLGKARRSRARTRRARSCASSGRPRRLVEYNRTDARLALEILERLRLVALSVERSKLTGLPLDRVSGSIAAFDFLYLSELRPSGRRRPQRARRPGREPQEGGHVLESMPGLYTQRRRAGLQEPVPEPDPHVRDRSLEPGAAGGGRGATRIPSWPPAAPPSSGGRPSSGRSSTSSCRSVRRRAAPATP